MEMFTHAGGGRKKEQFLSKEKLVLSSRVLEQNVYKKLIKGKGIAR